jgi:hypothetical protein
MHTAATSLPTATKTFAGALASAADPAWIDDGLADDVATITYEHALRNHARSHSRPDVADPLALSPASEKGLSSADEVRVPSDSSDARPLKTASITIRLSEPDCRQVRKRAAESGLTISAYLRSCTLEVETLRAQVKEALAQFRNPAESPAPQPRKPQPTSLQSILAALVHWFRRFAPQRKPAIRLNPSNPFAPLRY